MKSYNTRGSGVSLTQMWLALAVVLLALPIRLSAATDLVYVTNSAGDNVHVIDATTNKVVQVIKGIVVPHGVNFSPDGSRVYVSNESENVLDVVNRKTGEIIKKVPLSGHPNNIAVAKDGGRVVICIAEKPGGLAIVDTKSLEQVKVMPMRDRCHNPYITPDGKYAVAGSVAGKFLTVFDLQTEEPSWEVTFDTGVRPMAIEANPDGSTSRIFVQLSFLHGFAVVDFATHKEVARIVLPDGPKEIHDLSIVEGRAAAPSHGIGVSPDGKTLWVNSVFAKSVFVYSLPDLKLLGQAPTGGIPDWLSFSPDSKRVYISNSADMTVTAVDMKTLKEVALIPVGEVPKRSNTLVVP
jgi:YVTN family beta-propeller protein